MQLHIIRVCGHHQQDAAIYIRVDAARSSSSSNNNNNNNNNNRGMYSCSAVPWSSRWRASLHQPAELFYFHPLPPHRATFREAARRAAAAATAT